MRFLALVFAILVGWNSARVLSAQAEVPSCTLRLKIEGSIGPGQLHYLEQGFAIAEERKCRSLLLLINTPGGTLTTTRLMVEKILASPMPVLCLVSPSGGHAGSAGAILLMACHVSGAEPGTNIGAATPISGSGADVEKDARSKAIEDTVSWLKSLARLRGRSLEFADKIVTESRAYDATEAARIKAIDTVAPDVVRFLEFAEGRTVAMREGATATVTTGALVDLEAGLRVRFLKFVTDPQFAYLLFMASLALLYFEFTHAGAVVPGVAGGIGLVISLIAFHALDVWWGGVLLIFLGLAFLVAEAFLPSFGALGVGGLVAFTSGSLLLYEPGALSYALVFTASGTTALLILGIGVYAYRTRRKGGVTIEKSILGQKGEVASFEAPSLRRGMVKAGGEYWRFVSERDLKVGEKIEIVSQEGLTVRVRSIE